MTEAETIRTEEITRPHVYAATQSKNTATLNLADVDIKENTSTYMQDGILKLLNQYRQVCHIEGDTLGRTNVEEFDIKLKEDKIIYRPQYRVPHSQQEVLETVIKDMMRKDIIKESTSPFNSPLILVKKRDGTMRPCVDFRALNEITVPLRFPLPIISDLINNLDGSKYFSTIDLVSAFWQVPLTPEAAEKTAFSSKSGHYQFKVMPFGLINAPTFFCKLMHSILHELLGLGVLIYLDDIVVYSNTEEEHLKRLRELLEKLQQANLKIKLAKSKFAQSEIKFLGYKINETGLTVDPDRKKAIQNLPTPTNKDQLRSFLGALNYFRNFMAYYARIAEPLYMLLRKNVEFKWTDQQESALRTLKAKLLEPPILIYPNYTKQFYLCTDACDTGVGTVLLQEKNDKLHPISYASKTLSETERRYSTTKKEALALLFGLKQYRFILLGYPVTVFTDHQPLIMLFRKTLPQGSLGRWAVQCAEYNLQLRYLPGKLNLFADFLSRLSITMEQSKELTDEIDDKIEDAVLVVSQREQPVQVVLQGLQVTATNFTKEDVKRTQSSDSFCKHILQVVQGETLKIEGELSAFRVIDGLLFYIRKTERTGIPTAYFNLVVPEELLQAAIEACHTPIHAGHVGYERTLKNFRLNFFNNHECSKVQTYCSTCAQCIQNKMKPKRVPIGTFPIPSTPMTALTMDLLGPLPMSDNGMRYILVVKDFTTRYVILQALPDKTTVSVACALKASVFTHYGTPETLLSDNGTEFVSETINLLCKAYNIKKVQTAPYHPASNGLVERVNREINKLLKLYVGQSGHSNWDTYMCDFQLAINNTYNKSIGDTPFFVLYGYDSRQNTHWEITEDANYSYEDTARQRHRHLEQIRIFVKQRIQATTAETLKKVNRKLNVKSIKKGSRVFARHIITNSSTRKFTNLLDGPYIVLSKLNRNLFLIKHIITGHERRVHVDNLLMSCLNSYNHVSKDLTNVANQPHHQSHHDHEASSSRSLENATCKHDYNLRKRN